MRQTAILSFVTPFVSSASLLTFEESEGAGYTEATRGSRRDVWMTLPTVNGVGMVKPAYRTTHADSGALIWKRER